MAAQYEDDHPQLMQQIATINLSDPPLRHPFCHPDTLPPTMGELSARVDQGSIFPVSFGHTSIKQLKTQPMIAPNTPDPSDFVDFADKSYVKSTDGRDNRSTYHYDGNAAKSIKSASSSQTTPSKRDGRTEASAKSWLLGWLVHVDMFYCHVTHHVPYATPGFVQLAHILLPKAQINNNPLLLLYEFSLGMSVRSICLHSRLFIMPAVMHIHKLIDGQLIFIIPSLEVLRSALLYLNMVLDARSSKDQNEREKADFLWGQLRGGNLSAFVELADGNVHKYHIIPHPGANSWLRSLCFPCSGDGFYSHISPFAALLSAFRTLYAWKTLQSSAIDQEVDWSLLNALRTAGVPNIQEMVDITISIHSTMGLLAWAFMHETYRNVSWKGGSRSSEHFPERFPEYNLGHGLRFDGLGRSNNSGGGGSSSGDGADSSGGTGGPGSSFDAASGDASDGGAGDPGDDGRRDTGEPRGGSTNYDGTGLSAGGGDVFDNSSMPRSITANSIEPCLEDHSIFLPSISSSFSSWNHNNNSDGGVLAMEPNLHDPLLGPSPSQQIADEWCAKQLSPVSPPPMSPSPGPQRSLSSCTLSSSCPSILDSSSSATLLPYLFQKSLLSPPNLAVHSASPSILLLRMFQKFWYYQRPATSSAPGSTSISSAAR